MNQILLTKKIYNKIKKIYFILFIIFIFLILIISFTFFHNIYSIYAKRVNSKHALSIYKISTLYSNIPLSNNTAIIGMIDIPIINISYPIISKTSEELLKISPCRFAGPFPNRFGNMCIAAHNYKNNLMFSKLNKLEKKDSIYITDLNKDKFEYIVYEKYISSEDDWSCINQQNNIEITLITCNTSNNKERIIIKAKMKEF